MEGGSIDPSIQNKTENYEVPQKPVGKKRAFSKPYINVFGFVNHTYVVCGYKYMHLCLQLHKCGFSKVPKST